MDKLSEAEKILKKYGQGHLLANYEKLDEIKQDKLIEQILNIDFEQMEDLYKLTQKEITQDKDNIEPIKYIDKESLSEEEIEKYKIKGIEQIREGNCAVVTMAGGQRNKITDIQDLKEPLC